MPNINDKGEMPKKNEFKFAFHPDRDIMNRTYTFFIDFLKEDQEWVSHLLDTDKFCSLLEKAASPYGEQVIIESNKKVASNLFSFRIIIKFDQDGWEFVNSWRLR